MPTAISAMFGSAPNPPSEFTDIIALKGYLNITDSELLVIKKHRNRMYSHFLIPKRSGGFRKIDAPNARLLFLQRKILEVFVKMYKPRYPVHGFVKHRSAITNAQEHLKRKHILNIDLKDFFPSISQNRVSGLLSALGIPLEVRSALLAICCVDDRIPQGSPTSPIISNMISLRLDRRLMSFCKTRRIRFSRYADDLTFSLYSSPHQLFETGVPSPGRLKSAQISKELNSIIFENGFAPNENKIWYSGPSSRKEVTGLIVSDFVNVPRRFVRTVRAIIFDIEKNGYPASQIKFSTITKKISSLREHLRGKILWISQVKGINDEVYLGLARRYNVLFPEKVLTIGHSKGEIRDLSNWVLEKDVSSTNSSSQGSAFFLENYGLITAFHCVEGAKLIEVFHPHEPLQRYPVTISKFCKHRDLAILSHTIPSEKFLSLEMYEKTVWTGDKVRILGYPSFGPGSSLQVREASVVSHQTKSAVKQIVVDGKVNPGNSGGPIVDMFDRVIGVCHKGGPEEAMDIAIAIQELNGL